MSYPDLEIETGGGNYLKLKSGEVANIRIISKEPKKSVIHFIDKKKVDCLVNRALCEHCNAGDKPKQRWSTNVFDRKEKVVKIFEFGPAIGKQIKEIAQMLRENNSTIHDVDLRIKTTGSGLDTEYSVINIPNPEPIPEGLEELPF